MLPPPTHRSPARYWTCQEQDHLLASYDNDIAQAIGSCNVSLKYSCADPKMWFNENTFSPVGYSNISSLFDKDRKWPVPFWQHHIPVTGWRHIFISSQKTYVITSKAVMQWVNLSFQNKVCLRNWYQTWTMLCLGWIYPVCQQRQNHSFKDIIPVLQVKQISCEIHWEICWHYNKSTQEGKGIRTRPSSYHVYLQGYTFQ